MPALKKSNNSDGKGVAFEKRAKMDKVQQEILLIICGAAAIVGLGLVSSVYLVKTITYKAKVISAYDIVNGTYKDIQNNLVSIDSKITALASNENFESVAGKRDSNRCSSYAKVESLTLASSEELELYKTCSSLRAITDTMPSSQNKEAVLSSLNQLINWSNDGQGTNFDGISSDDGSDTVSLGFTQLQSANPNLNLNIMNSSVTLEDTSDSVKSALDMIESSIRSFDIVQAKLEFQGENTIKLSTTFSSYYSSAAELAKETRIVCGDAENDKCKAAGGETSDKTSSGSNDSTSTTGGTN